jgi:hypothetical protein
MRAVGIVALGHLLGSAQAAATDHVLYGWIFFSLVILLLIALGLPFREDADRMAAPRAPRPVPMAPGSGQWRAAALAGGLVVVVAALSPALAAQLDRMRPPIAASIPPVVLGPDCADVPLESPAPLDARGAMVKRRVACDGMVFDVTLDVFAARSTAAPVLTVAHTLGKLPNPTNDEEIVTESTWLPLSSGPQRLWWLTRTTRPGPMIAVAIWVDGRPATGGLATRARLAWTSLTGARIAPVVVAVSPELDHIRLTPDSRKAIEERLAAVLARADIGSQIAHIATPPD